MNKNWIYIVDNSSPNAFVMLQYMKKHCTTAHKRFYVSYILKFIKIRWK